MSLFDGVFKSTGQLQDEYRAHIEQLQTEQMKTQMEMRSADQRRIQAAKQQAQYNSIVGMGAQKAPNPLPRFDPNTSEAFQIPLSQAITMWRLKFGDKWFDAHQPRPDAGKDFYTDVFDRIKKAGLFESTDGWYRLKEDV
jgi:hypothetical protein